MQSTKVLAGRMRQLLSNIHPPQPPTSKESQQLLNVLHTSFRKQLDEAHPAPSSSTHRHTEDDNVIPLTHTDSSVHAASHHIKTMLTHPLLEHSDRNRAISNFCLNSVRAFETAYSESRMTTRLAMNLVKQYMQGLKAGNDVYKHQQMSPLVNVWVTALSPELKQDLFLSPQFLRPMVVLLSMEGYESKVWLWLRTIYERRGISASLQDSNWLKVEENLVSSLMRLAIEHNQLADATKQYVEACQYRVESRRADVASYRPNKTLPYEPLASSWMRLGAAIVHFRNRHGIPVDLFDAALTYSLDWSRSPETSKAFCLMYHPVEPTAKALYNALHLSDHRERLLANQKKAGNASRRAIMTSLLDGAQLSLNEGNRRQAEYLLDFAIDHYPDLLPPRETPEVEPQLQVSTQYAFG